MTDLVNELGFAKCLLERAVGPRRPLGLCETMRCPWCGEDLDGDEMEYIDRGKPIACPDCGREFVLGPLTMAETKTHEPCLIGLLSPADVRYQAWKAGNPFAWLPAPAPIEVTG